MARMFIVLARVAAASRGGGVTLDMAVWDTGRGGDSDDD